MTTPEVKRCAGCDETKSMVEFSRDKRSSDGLQGRCKACNRAYRAANRDRIREKDRKYQVANRDRIAEYKREHLAANRDQINERKREYWATEVHGLTRAERNYIEALQLARCAVCLDPFDDDMNIDHDHGCCPGGTSCGNCVRAVVHRRCNLIVGHYESGTLRDLELAEMAAFYLAMTPTRMDPFYANRDTRIAA